MDRRHYDWRSKHGHHKLKQPGHPEDKEDVINKRYFDCIVQQTKPYDFGRYIVFPHGNGTKTFYGAGTKRNIDLDDGKVFEIFNGDVHNPENIIYTPFRTLSSHIENLRMYAPFSIIPDLAKPWTFIFSLRPENQPMPRNNLEIKFSSSQSSETNRMTFTRAPGILTYNIDNQDPVRLEIESNKLNHFALEYNNKKL